MRDRSGDAVADFSRVHYRQPLVFLACCISLIYAVKSPGSLPILFAALSKFLQPSELSMHCESVPLMRSQVELIQNFSWQMFPKCELAALELRRGAVPSGMKPRIILMVAATHISVIVPTWNEEKYLAKCLRSLLDQAVKEPFEVIVVDGGSSDRTVDIARDYADKVIVERGQPVGAARNNGAKKADSEILAFMDADTIASPQWLSEVAATFRSDPSWV